jgi:hypothetical protein
VKKTIIAALASLMLAGAISAVSGATTNTATGLMVVVGDSYATIPLAVRVDESSDQKSLSK